MRSIWFGLKLGLSRIVPTPYPARARGDTKISTPGRRICEVQRHACKCNFSLVLIWELRRLPTVRYPKGSKPRHYIFMWIRLRFRYRNAAALVANARAALHWLDGDVKDIRRAAALIGIVPRGGMSIGNVV